VTAGRVNKSAANKFFIVFPKIEFEKIK